MFRIPFPTRLESFLCIVLVFLWASLPLLHSRIEMSPYFPSCPLPDRQKVQKFHFCSPFFERRKTRLCGLWVEVSSLLFSLSRLSLSGSSRGIKGRAMCRPLAHTQCHWPDSSPSVSHDQSSTGPYVFFIAAVSIRGGLAERERESAAGGTAGAGYLKRSLVPLIQPKSSV